MIWRLILDGAKDAFTNMAIDEAILQYTVSNSLQSPTLRFYTWSKPSISIGRFQNIEQEINLTACKQDNVPVVRRPTGGRAVFHNSELTYSLVIPDSYPNIPKNITESYRVISAAFVKGLKLLGINATLERPKLKKQESVTRKIEDRTENAGITGFVSKSPLCFAATSRYEVTVNGKKLIGSAQRRIQNAMLQQGSILLDYDPKQDQRYFLAIANETIAPCVTAINHHLPTPIQLETLINHLIQGFVIQFRIDFEPIELTNSERTLAEKLLTQKYRTDSWNYLRGKTAE
ncbi:MAG: lipoate--protein ligase family protein [bacterium]|nr:lipoate--protein ligase family protein [bacterium]